MTVERFMSKTTVTITPATSVLDIWKLLFSKHLHALPVIDKNRKLVGIISEEDFLEKLFPGYDELEDVLAQGDSDKEIDDKMKKLKKWTAEKIMNRRVYFTRPDTLVMRALSRMIARKVRQLPVIDDDDRLVGMISKADIFRGLFKKW